MARHRAKGLKVRERQIDVKRGDAAGVVQREHGTPAQSDCATVMNELHRELDRFHAVLNATTSRPDEDGNRRVMGVPHAVALSEATDRLYQRLAVAQQHLMAEHGRAVEGLPRGGVGARARSQDHPRTPAPVAVVHAAIGGTGIDAVCLAAIQSALEAAAFPVDRWNRLQAANPGGDHQRWHIGEVVSADALHAVESARRLLSRASREEGGDDAHPGNHAVGPGPSGGGGSGTAAAVEPVMLDVHIGVLRYLASRMGAVSRSTVWAACSAYGRDAIRRALNDMHRWGLVHSPHQGRSNTAALEAGRRWLREHDSSFRKQPSNNPATE